MTWITFLGLTILFWGSYNLFYKSIIATNMSVFLSIVVVGIVSAIVCVPFVIKNYFSGEVNYSLKGILLSILMGLCMGIGSIFFFYTFKYGAPTSVAVPAYGIGALLVGAIGGILIFKEVASLQMVLGFVFGIISIILLTIKK